MILPLLVLLVTVSSLVISAGTNCWDTGWGSTTNCWDICWDSGTDCSDFDWCSAKLFRDCSWIMSSLVWGGTVSLSFAKDELVSSKSKLNVSFDFSICYRFQRITVIPSVFYMIFWKCLILWLYLYETRIYLDVFELIVLDSKVVDFLHSIIWLFE